MFYQEEDRFWLVWILRAFLFLAVFVLLGRLVELQLIKGSYYQQLSEENRIRRVPISAPRGKILARGGEVLADNLEVTKKIVFDPALGYLKVEGEEKKEAAAEIKEWERQYPLAEKAAHLTGYLGEAGADEVEKVEPDCSTKGPLAKGALVGRGGLEESYNCFLSGVDGEELIEVNTVGKRVRTLGERKSVAGQDLRTTLDYGLQEKVAVEMSGKKGAVVVTDPQGEILALFSAPSFNPNDFILGDTRKLNLVLKDSSQPLFNRVISGLYQPGSVFKPLVAIAALEEGKINKDYRYNDEGEIVLKTAYGTFRYGNWYFDQYGRTEGEIDVTRALARSTDTFFYKVGELVGIDGLVDWADKFGLNSKTGIDLPAEAEGLVPTPEWKLRVKGESWFLGNTYHLAIGQGDLAVSVIALNRAIAALANGGYLCRPHLVGKSECSNLNLNAENLELVKKGMMMVCRTGGTAFPFFNFNESVACKTGTAETGEKDTTHAWFTFFAPVEKPEIVVTVFVEQGGEGSQAAAPLAREIADFWFNRKNSN